MDPNSLPGHHQHHLRASELLGPRRLNQSSEVTGWVVVGVLGGLLVLALIGCALYAKRMPADVGTQICRCGGCRRRFRVSANIQADTFMCRRCIREGRRRASVVEAEEREKRLDSLNNAPKKVMTLHRVSSHFYRMKSKVFGGESSSDSLSDTTELNTRSNSRPTMSIRRGFTKAVDAGQVEVPESELCKICFDAEARVVLLPCGHGGLCEGCAKDLIIASSECYICRQPVKLIAKLGRKALPRTTSTTSAVSRQASGMSADNYLAEVVGPDQLHHLESRRAELQAARLGVDPSEASESTTRIPLAAASAATGENPSMGTPAIAHEVSQLTADGGAPPQRLMSTVAASSPGLDDQAVDLAAPAGTRAVTAATGELDRPSMPKPPTLPTGAAETGVVGEPSSTLAPLGSAANQSNGQQQQQSATEQSPIYPPEMNMPPPRAVTTGQGTAPNGGQDVTRV
ncbi:hypothetical protein FOZ60_013237 [Perkinsus olseni]|uniref:RING-type domain-containing protein n=2 Tax=Perkinsus olseni TaxID=32597 RepID=A0A7J6NCE7_PEROL|nr:hypothetical protein FOZ60_013237 [Perkinsus olseni]